MLRFQRAALAALLLGLTSTGAPADSIPVHLGDLASGGSLRSFDEASGFLLPADPALEGLRLLPIGLTGRLRQNDLLPGHARWLAAPAGLGRVKLPGGQGMLLRFERVLPGGGSSFGLLRVDPTGQVELHGERAGSGPAGDQDPYNAIVAVAPGGLEVLVSTRLEAGGDVLRLDLAAGSSLDLSAGMAPRDWRPASLRFGAGWVVAVAADGIYRGAPGGPLAAVPLDTTPALFTGELVLSPDRSHALTTAGSGPLALHALTLGLSGAARRVTSTELPLSGAGFEPEYACGPFLAVSNDGEYGAWRQLSAVPGGARELFVRGASAPASSQAVHVTSDAVILDTLDEVGVLTMAQPGTMVVAVGSQAPIEDGGIEGIDLFQVDLATGAMQNLTGTSGDLTEPFEAKGTLNPYRRNTLPGGGGELVFDDQSSGTGRLLHLMPSGSLQVLEQEVRDVAFVEEIGDRVVVALRQGDDGIWKVLAYPADLSGPAQEVATLGEVMPESWTVGSAGWLAFTAGGKLYRYQSGAAQAKKLPAPVLAYGDVLGWTSSDGLLFSISRGGVTGYAIWPTDGTPLRRLKAISPGGSLLPAR